MARFSVLTRPQLTSILKYYDEIAPENESIQDLSSRVATFFDNTWMSPILNQKKIHPLLIEVTQKSAFNIWRAFQPTDGKQFYKTLPIQGLTVLALDLGIYPEDVLQSWLWEQYNENIDRENFDLLLSKVVGYKKDPVDLLQRAIAPKLVSNLDTIKSIDKLYQEQQKAKDAAAKK